MAKKIAKKDILLKWDFPSTNGVEDDGFSDPLLEYFQGDHEKFIAREAIQNAIDARLDDSMPVLVEFERFDMPTADMPGHETIFKKMKRCMEFVKGQDKAENFFKASIEMLEKKKIPILRIGDFNTIGLSGGDKDRDGGWYRLVKAVGTSSPKGAGGGSFGIGKGAPIAASSIRTVFYSTINENGEPVFQGKARLVSHYGDDGDTKRGVGLYGINGYQSVRTAGFIPSMFRREERGTDIYIMGYATKDAWQEGLMKSVLDNFWLAIYDGDLEVSISDGKKILITKDNLKELLEELSPNDAMPFYLAVTSKDNNCFAKSLDTLGNVRLFVKKRDDFPGLVMLARKPKMMVKSEHYKALREPYAAVFLCDNDRGNMVLRDTEPPAHNEWNKELAQDKELGKAAIKEMEKYIRDSLKSLGETINTELQDIPGLDRYLPDSDYGDYESKQNDMASELSGAANNEESAREVGAVKESTETEIDNVIRRSIMVKHPDGGQGGNGRREGTGGGGSVGKGGGEEEGKDGERIRTADISFRSFVQKTKTGIEYHFIITGREDCRGAIRLVAVGDDGIYPAEIKIARNLDSKQSCEVSGSLIKGLSISKGQTARLGVELASKNKYAIGIENYER